MHDFLSGDLDALSRRRAAPDAIVNDANSSAHIDEPMHAVAHCFDNEEWPPLPINDTSSSGLVNEPAHAAADIFDNEEWPARYPAVGLRARGHQIPVTRRPAAGAAAFGRAYSSDEDGDGPPRRARSAPAFRRTADLQVARLGVPATQQRRARLLPQFVDYADRHDRSVQELIDDDDAVGMSKLLADYGQTMYAAQGSRSNYSETINAVQKVHSNFRTRLRLAWEIDRAWEGLEPGQPRAPVPPVLLRAAVAICLLWDEPRLAVLLALMFEGCLRPNDGAMLTRRDLRFPAESGLLPHEDFALFISLEHSKTRHLTARTQHVRIVGDGLIHAAERVFGRLEPNEYLVNLNTINPTKRAEKLSNLFNSVLHALRVPVGEKKGYVLSGLRGGGLTALWRATGDMALVTWRGRWTSMKSLPNYLQELESLRTYSAIPRAIRTELETLSARLPHLLDRV